MMDYLRMEVAPASQVTCLVAVGAVVVVAVVDYLNLNYYYYLLLFDSGLGNDY